MAKYLLIQSRDPFEAGEVERDYELAAQLAGDGNEVTLFLVQNGVVPARSTAKKNGLAAVASTGVQVLADEFSLKERGIDKSRLLAGVQVAPLDTVVDQLADGRKALWL